VPCMPSKCIRAPSHKMSPTHRVARRCSRRSGQDQEARRNARAIPSTTRRRRQRSQHFRLVLDQEARHKLGPLRPADHALVAFCRYGKSGRTCLPQQGYPVQVTSSSSEAGSHSATTPQATETLAVGSTLSAPTATRRPRAEPTWWPSPLVKADRGSRGLAGSRAAP
jgi:hypothetical protein